jgi:hypothetical protein
LNIGRHHQESLNRKGMEKIGESKKKENGTLHPKLSYLQRWDDSLKKNMKLRKLLLSTSPQAQ